MVACESRSSTNPRSALDRDRMREHGVPVRLVIWAGGIPQTNEVLNRACGRQNEDQARRHHLEWTTTRQTRLT